MSSADLFDDTWPHTHGTPDGFDNGCKASRCPAADAYGLSCKQAKTLSRYDTKYRDLVKNGATVAEIADAFGYIGTATAHVPTPKTIAKKTRKPTATPPSPEARAALDEPTAVAEDIRAVDEPIIDTTAPAPADVEQLPTAPAAESAPTAETTAQVAVDEKPAPTTKEIRAWARQKGYDVADRGIIATEIIEHYWEAHGLLDPTRQLPVNNPDPQVSAELAVDEAPATVIDQLEAADQREGDGVTSISTEQRHALYDELDNVLDQIEASTEADSIEDVIDARDAAANILERVREETEPRPEWSAIVLAEDLERITGERDRARDLAARLEEENARSQDAYDTMRQAHRDALADINRLIELDYAKKQRIDELNTENERLATAHAASADSLSTTTKALELVLQKWDEATRPNALDRAIADLRYTDQAGYGEPISDAAGAAVEDSPAARLGRAASGSFFDADRWAGRA